MWQPEMGPMVYTIVKSVSPKARATPAKPIPRAGNAAASTALPQPPKTSQKVPNVSAASRLESGICYLHPHVRRKLGYLSSYRATARPSVAHDGNDRRSFATQGGAPRSSRLDRHYIAPPRAGVHNERDTI